MLHVYFPDRKGHIVLKIGALQGLILQVYFAEKKGKLSAKLGLPVACKKLAIWPIFLLKWLFLRWLSIFWIPCHALVWLASHRMIWWFQKGAVCTDVQKTAKLQLVTVGVIIFYRISGHPQSLRIHNFAVLWATVTYSMFLETPNQLILKAKSVMVWHDI